MSGAGAIVAVAFIVLASTSCGGSLTPSTHCPALAVSVAAEQPPRQFVQLTHWAPVRGLAISPSARFLASYAEDRTIRIWDMTHRRAVRLFLAEVDVTSLAWDGDERLMIGRAEHNAVLVDVAAAREVTFLADAARPERLTWPDSSMRWIAWSQRTDPRRRDDPRQTRFAGYDSLGNKREYLFGPCDDPEGWGMATGNTVIEPGGLAVAAVCSGFNATLELWLREPGDRLFRERVALPLPIAGYAVDHLAVSGAGRLAVAAPWDAPEESEERKVYLLSEQGARQLPTAELTHRVARVAANPDGTSVAAVGGTLVVWRAEDATVSWSNAAHHFETLVYSPDGRFVLAGAKDGRIRMFHAANGRPAGEFGAAIHRPHVVRFAPEGLVAASSTRRVVWSLDQGRLLQRKALPPVTDPADPSSALQGAIAATSDDGTDAHGVPSYGAVLEPAGEPGATPGTLVPGQTVMVEGPGDTTLVGTRQGDLCVIRDGMVVARGASDGLAIAAAWLEPGGRRAVTYSQDGALRAWNAQTAELLATFIDFEDEEWLVATPGGAYDGTAEVDTRIGWAFERPLEFFTFEQFRQVFHDPSLLRRRLAGESVDVDLQLSRPPRVGLVSAPTGVVETAQADVRVGASSRRRVSAVRAFSEGRQVDAKLVCARRTEATLRMPLLPGVNRASIVAFDDRGFASNALEIDLTGAPGPRKPDVWVVAAGVSQYPNLPAGYQLALADDDARAIAEVFREAAGPGRPFGRAHITVLTEAQVTVERIEQALQQLSSMRRDDIAVVFFSGHGIKPTQAGDMVFVTSPATLAPADLARAGIGWERIAAKLAAAPGRVLVLLDACHAGHISQQLVVPNDELARALVQTQRAGALVFAASKGRQQSFEPKHAKGVKLEGAPSPQRAGTPAPTSTHLGLFTQALVDALSDGQTDRNGDGAIQASEIVDEVTRRVTELSQGRQTPWVARRDMFGDFKLLDAPKP